MNGKQVRVKRPETIDGMDIGEFIRRNADPIWLHQNEMWEYMDQDPRGRRRNLEHQAHRPVQACANICANKSLKRTLRGDATPKYLGFGKHIRRSSYLALYRRSA
jgi:hypothetical protein